MAWIASQSSVGFWIYLMLVFVLAGFVKGVVGLGLPTVAMALLALRMTPAHAAALLVMPALLSNIWQAAPWACVAGPRPRLGGMLWGCAMGTGVGLACWGAPTEGPASVVLALALLAYGMWGLLTPVWRLPSSAPAWWGSAVGGLTGLLMAASGVSVLPAVPYLQALGLGRDALMRAMGSVFAVATLALGLGLWWQASLDIWVLGVSLLLLLPAVAGMQLGAALRGRLSATVFRRSLFIGLLVLGSQGLWRALA